MILTPDGEEPVEWLEAGVRVVTRDHGTQPLASVLRFDCRPGQRAVEIMAGGVDGLLPDEPMTVTANQNILLRAAAAELYFGASEVLVPAQAWVGGHLVRETVATRPVTFAALAFHQPEIVQACGIWVKTSRSDTVSGGEDRETSCGPGLFGRQVPRPCLTLHEAALVVRPARTGAGRRAFAG